MNVPDNRINHMASNQRIFCVMSNGTHSGVQSKSRFHIVSQVTEIVTEWLNKFQYKWRHIEIWRYHNVLADCTVDNCQNQMYNYANAPLYIISTNEFDAIVCRRYRNLLLSTVKSGQWQLFIYWLFGFYFIYQNWRHWNWIRTIL